MSTSVAAAAVAASIPRSEAPPSPSYSPPGAGSTSNHIPSAKPQYPLPVAAGPHTPTSPSTPFMSQTTSQQHNNVSPSTTATATTTTSMSSGAPASQPTAATFTSTPPSSAAMSTQNSQQPIMTTTNTFPTPASSVAGTVAPSIRGGGDLEERSMVRDGDGDQVMEDTQDDAQSKLHPTQKPSTSPHSSPTETADRFYLLCKTPYPKSRPHATDDLIPLYNLTHLASTVARTDPLTGEKRAIRKTYKGKIKAFNLSGRDKEVVHPLDQPGGLLETASWPAEEWYAQKVAGKPAQLGLSADILGKLETALAFEPGNLPGFDASVLGIEPVNPGPVAADGKVPAGPKTAATNGALPRAPAPTSTSPAAATAEPPRPKRAGKKRRYDEHSFEGYGEGFVDDDADGAAGAGGGGYSTSDGGEKRGGKKKRKKNSESFGNTVTSPGALERGGSYGVGMVGVGSGYGGR